MTARALNKGIVLNHIAFLSIGSNLGDKVKNCQRGIEALNASDGTVVITQSPFYRTQPVDYIDQNWFINAALKIGTDLTPHHLLKLLNTIERLVGTTSKTIRFGPRILDMDIVLYDDLIMDSPELIIPHPRMHKRCFVLKPLCDIDPQVNHPILKLSLLEILNTIKDNDQKVLRYI